MDSRISQRALSKERKANGAKQMVDVRLEFCENSAETALTDPTMVCARQSRTGSLLDSGVKSKLDECKRSYVLR